MYLRLPILQWKVQKFDAGPLLKDSEPAGSPESCFGCPATESQITATQKHSAPVNTKHAQIEQKCVEGLFRVLDANVFSSWWASSTFFYLPSKGSWLVGSCSKFAIKMEIHIPQVLNTRFVEEFFVTLLANCMLLCMSITSSGNWTWINGSSVSESLHSLSCSFPQSQILHYSCLWMSVVDDRPPACQKLDFFVVILRMHTLYEAHQFHLGSSPNSLRKLTKFNCYDVSWW